ncbi:MAG TPA: DUF3175 domain-containing protein [Chitinophagaceae bacterium]
MAAKKLATSKRTPVKKSARTSASKKKWSKAVTENSNVLDLENGVFKNKSAKKIAHSLKRSAEHSKRRKSSPFQSSMSMLNFYLNRAGKSLSKTEKQPLEKAKDELRKLFHKNK